MANKKLPYNWKRVKAGDIISFKYKKESTGKVRVNSILVLNPIMDVKLKDGTSKRHLIGVKLEESNKVKLLLNSQRIRLLEKIGDFIKIDDKNNLYKLSIKDTFVINDRKGIKKQAWDIISKNLSINGKYRTYDYDKAIKSSVYLEPIRARMKDED
jgi:hypothetical protein|tara:strand:- start:545 stop:1012 length:468 start_codon:yes stop_codon:yes gene_type:complete